MLEPHRTNDGLRKVTKDDAGKTAMTVGKTTDA